MTKFFKATVTLQKVVNTDVAGETEDDARREARTRALATLGAGDFKVVRVELLADGETEYAVGVRAKHRLFGTGEIKELSRNTNGLGHSGFAVTINFDQGGIKGVSLPLPKDTLEILAIE
jgi:hypothetical protein